jgi:hypothetical protein
VHPEVLAKLKPLMGDEVVRLSKCRLGIWIEAHEEPEG